MDHEPDKQRSKMPYTPISFPLRDIPGAPPDGPNRLDTPDTTRAGATVEAGVSATTLLDNPYASEIAIAAANAGIDPQTSVTPGFFDALRRGLSALGEVGLKTWLVAGAGLGLAIFLLVLRSSKPTRSAPIKIPSQVTPELAFSPQQNLDKGLASADKDLLKVGVGADAIAQAHNQVKLVEGSQIVLSVHPAYSANRAALMPKAVIVTGPTNPAQYTALATVDANRYVDTLSPAPSLSNLTENSAVVHGMKSNP